jgi:hypothetical protein
MPDNRAHFATYFARFTSEIRPIRLVISANRPIPVPNHANAAEKRRIFARGDEIRAYLSCGRFLQNR